MPLEMADPDDVDGSRPDWGRKNAKRLGRRETDVPGAPWWRPASTAGRVFLALCTLTVLGSLGTGAFLLKHYLERDARFRIEGSSDIEAAGLSQVSRADLLPVFGEDIGRNVFFVPLAERRKELEAIPWVERATVMRLLPDQLRVQIVERKPVAFVREDQQIELVDASGVLLTMPPTTMAQHHYSFPVVTGIGPRDPPASRAARMAVYQRLMGELDANGQHNSEQISEIDLTDPEDARVMMPEQGTDILAHFGEDQFLERFERYKAHIAEWRQQYPKLAAVDLRYDQQVVLEMTTGADAAASTDGATTGSDANKPDANKPAAGEPIANAAAASTEKTVSRAPAAKSTNVKSTNKKTAKASAAAKKKTAQSKRTTANLIRHRTAPIRTVESD
jgi:cell division protein FtsQ